VPRGSELHLDILLRGKDEMPFARRVALVKAAEPVPATPMPATEVPRLTGTPTTASTATVAPATLTPTPEASPTRTATQAPATATEANPPLSGQPLESLDILTGILESEPTEADWAVRDSDEGRVVKVDVRGLDNLPAELEAGEEVQLEGRWQGADRFVAAHLRHHRAAACSMAETIGRIAAIDSEALALESGQRFVVRPGAPLDVTNGPAAPGDAVRVAYETCGAIRYVLTIEVLRAATPEPANVTGTVTELGAGELVLGRLQGGPAGATVRVRFDAGLAIEGNAPLAVGAIVRADGQWLEAGVLLQASRIQVLRAAPVADGAPDAGGTPPPPATEDAPAPGATPTPTM
jgi:hypothetical protein